ncbi:MAG: molybdenum cofactor guanylyltransferase [Dehalococcoidia bacterium]|nr:molybdenum cofactor guanylyltransferase [Dehalococcoidia bacterium]
MRLGRVKALERINEQSLIERTIDCLSTVSQALLVVTSREQFRLIAAARLKGRLIVDIYPGKGALGGIYTGLTGADSFYSLVVGCDMPFLNRDLLCYLIEIAPSFDVVVPRIDNMLEPLHAVYSRDCLAPIKELIGKDRLGISQLFKLVKTRYVDKDEIAKFDPRCLSFFNINTLDDMKKAKDLIEQREHCVTIRKDEF